MYLNSYLMYPVCYLWCTLFQGKKCVQVYVQDHSDVGSKTAVQSVSRSLKQACMLHMSLGDDSTSWFSSSRPVGCKITPSESSSNHYLWITNVQKEQNSPDVTSDVTKLPLIYSPCKTNYIGYRFVTCNLSFSAAKISWFMVGNPPGVSP
jgi:hypothetical protein